MSLELSKEQAAVEMAQPVPVNCIDDSRSTIVENNIEFKIVTATGIPLFDNLIRVSKLTEMVWVMVVIEDFLLV